MENIEDVYTVGELAKDMVRWRPFVDVLPDGRLDPEWTPQLHNDYLLEMHRRTGRLAWEHAVVHGSLAEDSDRKWECASIYDHFRLIAEIDLRRVEIEICAFQLTANTVGIRTDAAHRNDLYLATSVAHNLHLLMWDLSCKSVKKKSGRGELMQHKPSVTDRASGLAAKLDKELFAVHFLSSEALPKLSTSLEHADAMALARRMSLLIKCLDKVIVVL